MTYRAALRQAARMRIDDDLVEECLGDDRLFRKAWSAGLDALTPDDRRGRLCVDLGTIAESVATLLLLGAGLEVFAELATPGVHGTDLLALTPTGEVLALEVKGTLRADAIPRIGRGRLRQMSLAWLDSQSNPAMVEWGLTGAEIYGGIASLDFATRSWRVALTADYESFSPVRDVAGLCTIAMAE